MMKNIFISFIILSILILLILSFYIFLLKVPQNGKTMITWIFETKFFRIKFKSKHNNHSKD